MKDRAALVLAAGEGKRMKSDLPKVLHRLRGKPLLHWVLDAVESARFPRAVVIVGHGGEAVKAASERPGVEFVWQREQKGTGHAVMQAEPLLRDFDGSLVVLSGDVPLVRPGTLERLVSVHEERRAAVTVITAEMPDPTGYGRIVRDAGGEVDRIVEQKDAAPEEREIREINSGTYCFDCRALFEVLPLLRSENAGGEFYLTDTIAKLRERGRVVAPFPVADRWEIFGINTPEHLGLAEKRLAPGG
ncbi:MAG: NTP transferase domain-containing protein [Candidatus Eisenbacteria bacterium]